MAVEGFDTPDDPLTDSAVEDLSVDASRVSGHESYDPGEKCSFYQHVRRCQIVGVHAYGSAATGIGTDMMVDSLVHGCVAQDCGRNFGAARDGLNVGSNGIGIETGLAADAEPVAVADRHARDNAVRNNGIVFENQATGEQETEYHAGRFFAHTSVRRSATASAFGPPRTVTCSSRTVRPTPTRRTASDRRERRRASGGAPPPLPAREHLITGCHVRGAEVVRRLPGAHADSET